MRYYSATIFELDVIAYKNNHLKVSPPQPCLLRHQVFTLANPIMRNYNTIISNAYALP